MNVKQLKEELAKYPDDMDVMFAEADIGFKYNSVETVTKAVVRFHEEGSDPGEKPEAFVDCVILVSF